MYCCIIRLLIFLFSDTFEHHIWGSYYNFKGVNVMSFSKVEAETELP